MSLLREIGYASAAILKTLVGPMLGKDELIDSVGYVVSNGPPTSVVPDFIGQHLYDSSTPTWYKAHGVAAGQWTLSGVPSNVVLAQTDPVTGVITLSNSSIDVGRAAGLQSNALSDPRPGGETLQIFNTLTGLTDIGTLTKSVDSTVTYNGQPTVKLTIPANTTAGIGLTPALATRLREKKLTIVAYLPDRTKVAKILPYLSATSGGVGAAYSKYTNYIPTGASTRNAYNGWHYVDIVSGMWTDVTTGVPFDGTAMGYLRLDITADASGDAVVYLALATLQVKERARVFMTFDDGRISLIQNNWPIARKFNVPLTCYIIPSLLGNASSITQAQAMTMQNAGCCMGNHTWDHVDYSSVGLSAFLASLETARSWLVANGFNGSGIHAYPVGKYDETLVAAMPAAGMINCRTIAGYNLTGTELETRSLGTSRRYALTGALQLSSSLSLAQAKTEVDNAVLAGRSLIITGHDIWTAAEGGAAETSWLDTDYEALLAYIAAYRANGEIDTLTMDRFFENAANITCVPAQP